MITELKTNGVDSDHVTIRNNRSQPIPPLSHILDSMTNGILILDRHGCILIGNSAAEHLLGMSHHTLLTHSWDSLCLTQRDHARSTFPTLAMLHSAHPKTHLMRWERPPCHIVLDVSMTLICQEQSPSHYDATEHYLIQIVDVTERLEQEMHLRKRERTAACCDLIGRIAHVVNSPLQTILGVFMLASDASDSERTELFSIGQSEIERLGTTIHHLDQFYQAQGLALQGELDTQIERAQHSHA